jgi:signal transduction histidine kinase
MTTKEKSNYEYFHAVAIIAIILIFTAKMWFNLSEDNSTKSKLQKDVVTSID